MTLVVNIIKGLGVTILVLSLVAVGIVLLTGSILLTAGGMLTYILTWVKSPLEIPLTPEDGLRTFGDIFKAFARGFGADRSVEALLLWILNRSASWMIAVLALVFFPNPALTIFLLGKDPAGWLAYAYLAYIGFLPINARGFLGGAIVWTIAPIVGPFLWEATKWTWSSITLKYGGWMWKGLKP